MKKSIFETELAVKIGNEVIEEMKKTNPNIIKPYEGYLKPYLDEYIRIFLLNDAKQFIGKDYKLNKIGIEDLTTEMIYIECFCRWLDEEKGVKLK